MNKKVKSPKGEFLTTSQAADLLNVSISTFKKFITTGKIKVIKTPGGHYRVSRKLLMEKLYA